MSSRFSFASLVLYQLQISFMVQAELSEKTQRQQAAIWELVTTERTYIQVNCCRI